MLSTEFLPSMLGIKQVLEIKITGVASSENKLKLSMSSKNFRQHFETFFLFFLENTLWHFMQIVSLADNLQEMSNHISGNNIINLKKKKCFYFSMKTMLWVLIRSISVVPHWDTSLVPTTCLHEDIRQISVILGWKKKMPYVEPGITQATPVYCPHQPTCNKISLW